MCVNETFEIWISQTIEKMNLNLCLCVRIWLVVRCQAFIEFTQSIEVCHYSKTKHIEQFSATACLVGSVNIDIAW